MAISEMANKGRNKLARKAPQMAASWDAAKTRMVAGFRGVGFGPTRVRNYEAGIGAAAYKAPDPDKWARNWSAKMAE